MTSINNRVRLYELSKELDRDTKDIIMMCEQLNIAVKSHSSTITEDEARQVRAAAAHDPHPLAAEKSNESASERKTADPSHRLDKEAKEAKEAEQRAAKQQILAVSKPAIRLNTPPMQTDATNATPPIRPEHKPETENKATENATSPAEVAAAPVVVPVAPLRPAAVNAAKQGETKAQTVNSGGNTNAPARPKVEAKKSEPKSPAPEARNSKSDMKVEKPELKLAPKPEIKSVSPAPVIAAVIPPNGTNPEAAPALNQPKNPSGGDGADHAKNNAPNNAPKAALVNPPRLNRPMQPERPKPPAAAVPAAPRPVAPKPPKANNDPQPTAKQGNAPQGGDNQRQEAKANHEGGKQPRNERPNQERGGDRPDKPKLNKLPEAPANPSRPKVPKLVKDSVLIERGITAPNEPPHALRPPTPPALRGPERPTPPSERLVKRAAAPGGSSDGEERTPPPTLLEKPTLPGNKPSKRAKVKKQDEEADVLELKEKSRNAKGKRYLRDFDDDDDDLLLGDLDGSNEVPVSLSLARPATRPPKPSAPKLVPAITVKSADSKGQRGKHRDRRAPVEVVIEKPTTVIIDDAITVAELSNRLMVSETDIIRTLFMKGIMVSITQTLEVETASMVATELGYTIEAGEQIELARKTEMIEFTDLENLERRPPVVTIMGHVDHGKTTLLDAIRQTKVAAGEAGGITQHIGAYHVDVEHDGKKQQIVFLDTPGHEAFTAMRARGAKVTDIAILVVAADDGVQPQTVEAISHAKAAKVPIIVAINKIDKIEAQPDRIRQELTEYSLVAEEWGGDTIMVPVSAIKRENLDALLEMIVLVSEVEDLQANPNRTAKGTIIEAHLDKARGPVATFLIQNGTLRVGDVFVAGSVFGKVRAMVDDRGNRVEAGSPSFAVEVLGLSDVPAAGDEFEVYLDEKQARAIADERSIEQRHTRLLAMGSRRVTLGTLSAKAQEGELKELNIILKADMQGSLEAINNALSQLPQHEVQLRVLLSAPGEISENDVSLAAASDAVVVGFSTTMAPGARQAADELGVDVRDYNIIYKLLEDIQGAMEGLLEPELVEEPLGQAEVRALFAVGKSVVAGCYVQSGKLVRNCNVRVRRNGAVIHESALDSLRRVKDDVKEVAQNFECGISLNRYTNWKEGDVIEAFRMVTKRRTLSAN
ncbi:MAG: translation initiation factor IF-2 [Pseudanabaena sp. ELA607]